MKMETPPPRSPKAKPAPKAKAATRWHGALEGMHGGLLYGWAIDAQQPDARVVLEVCLSGEVVGCLIADVARTDRTEQFAAAAGAKPADPCHGFVADLGAASEKQNGLLTVRIANTDASLPGHVDRTAAAKPPASATSMVFSDGALRLHGWAIDVANEKRSLTVRAFVGNQQVAETVANLTHPAMRSYDVGMHGFDLKLPLTLADGNIHTVRVVDENGSILNGSPATVCCFAAGGKALLGAQQDPLLTDVIDAYERYLPRSLSMEHYSQWSALFETASPQPPTDGASAATLRVGLIVTGDGDAAAHERTAASVTAQTGANVQLFAPAGKANKPRPFATLLQLAIDAGCDIIGCVRAGDTLPAHALASALHGFALPGAELVYTDSERAGAPWLKPAWNPDYALASDYPLELMLARSSVLQTIAARALPQTQAALSWQLLATLWPQGAAAIVHVPRVLYQFNSPLSETELAARAAAARAALTALEPAAALEPLAKAPPGAGFDARRLQRTLSKREKTTPVSLIIPTRDHADMLKRCIDSIGKFTKWPNLEIIVIDNGSTEPKTKTYFRALAKQGVKVLPLPGPFNFAALNNAAVEAASGDIVGLINNDIEALHDGWLDEIVSQLLRPGVGAVGAKLLWPNGMVQHGGVLLGVGNVAGHFGNRLADADWGDHGRNQLIQQVSGVTAACLFLRKRDYLAVGGMDAVAFPVAFNDVDLCLKLRSEGKAIIWTPHARMLHAESASRGHEDTPQKRARAQREVDQLRQRWGAVLLRDPAYHPSLNLDAHSHAFGGLALPPRDRSPRQSGIKK